MNRSLAGFLVAFAGVALGQTADSKKAANTQLTFEVATVKPSAPPQSAPGGRGFVVMMGQRGGPGTNDPTRWACNNCNMMMLMSQAYGVQRWELSVPSSMDNERFDVTAKVPEGATKEQLKPMLQNLLEERFKLTIHREKKEVQVSELTVNKGGPKLKEAAPVEEPPKPATPPGEGVTPPPPPPLPQIVGGQLKLDKDGFPELPKIPGGAGRGGPRMMMMNGRSRMQGDAMSMDDLAKWLSGQMGRPVTDGTGLKAKYDITLTFDGSSLGGGGRGFGGPGMQMMVQSGGPGGGPGSGGGGGGDTPLGPNNDDPNALPTIFGALQNQLGLKLDQKKGQIEIIVVDHVEKIPTEN
jgi:uncharacterized protein (TIGR03435 family)